MGQQPYAEKRIKLSRNRNRGFTGRPPMIPPKFFEWATGGLRLGPPHGPQNFLKPKSINRIIIKTIIEVIKWLILVKVM